MVRVFKKEVKSSINGIETGIGSVSSAAEQIYPLTQEKVINK